MTQPGQCLDVQLTHPLFGQSQAHADLREDRGWLSVQPITSDDDRAQPAWQTSHHSPHHNAQLLGFAPLQRTHLFRTPPRGTIRTATSHSRG